MQMIIKDGIIVATHEDSQVVAGKYPGCECISWNKPLPVREICDPPLQDPRTKEDKAAAYRDKRRVAYPSVQDQLDMLYHDTVNNTYTWMAAIKAVKQQYPKLEAK
jgi:hypothetical protein